MNLTGHFSRGPGETRTLHAMHGNSADRLPASMPGCGERIQTLHLSSFFLR